MKIRGPSAVLLYFPQKDSLVSFDACNMLQTRMFVPLGTHITGVGNLPVTLATIADKLTLKITETCPKHFL